VRPSRLATCSAGGSLVITGRRYQQTVGALYKRAWDEQVRHGLVMVTPPWHEPGAILRLLDARRISGAPSTGPCGIVLVSKAGHRPVTSGSSIYPAVQNYAWRRERAALARL